MASPRTDTPQARQAFRDDLRSSADDFVARLPKVELHIHIEGTLTPALRWKFSKRNNLPVRMGKNPRDLQSIEEVEKAYRDVISSSQLPAYAGLDPSDIPATFFEAYYSGTEVLKTREDFFELATGYFERAAKMNVRYCEVFFDPQSHTARGVSWEDLMGGLKSAQEKAEKELNVKSGWIMCFLRDQPPASAMEHYIAAQPYRDMIIGIGLDSNEHKKPPSLFADIYALARRDGFKITGHCDVGQQDTHANIHQLATDIRADRIDHGLNAADKPELIEELVEGGIGLTICPWAYLRRWTYDEVTDRVNVLRREGVKMCISSDGPPLMDDCWVYENLLWVRRMGMGKQEMVEMMRTAVGMTWAEAGVKRGLLEELDSYQMSL